MADWGLNDTVVAPAPSAAVSWGADDPIVQQAPANPPPSTEAVPNFSLDRAGGSVATGINDALATSAGAFVDLMTGALNLGARGINAAGGAAGYNPNLGQIEHPFGGSESIKSGIAATVGRTDPQTGIESTLYGAGAGAGAALSGMGAGAALSAAGRLPTVANALLGGGATPGRIAGNAGIGAASGVGSVGGEALAGQVTDNPAIKKTAGLVGGLAAGFGAAGAASAVDNAARGIRAAARPLTPGGQQIVAGRALNEAAVNGIPAEADAPLGIKPTLGQLSNDPGLLSLEQTVTKAGGDRIAGDLAATRTQNNQTILSGIEQIGAREAPEVVSQRLAQLLDENRATVQAKGSAAFKAIDPDNSIQVPTGPLKDTFKTFTSELTAARQRFIPKEYADLLNAYPPMVPMRELIDLRSSLTNDIRAARGAGDYNRANVLQGIDGALFKGIPEGGAPLPANLGQAATARYQNALDQWREYKQTFGRGPLAKVFAVDGQGAERVPDSAVADHLLAPGRGQTERVRQFISAAQAHPDNTPAIMQTAREWFASKLQNASQGAVQDAAGDQMVLGNKLRQFVQNNRPLINSDLFTSAQRELIHDIARAATMVERTVRAGSSAGGSDTAMRLAGGKNLQALVGGWFEPAVRAVIQGGSTVGGFMYGGVAGAVGAAGGATGFAMPLVKKLYADAGQKVMGILTEAMRDPALARDLMKKAADKDIRFSSPRLANYLATLPVTADAVMPSSRQGPPVDLAADAVSKMGAGEPVTRRTLMDATGLRDVDKVAEVRGELIRRGMIDSQNGRYLRAATINHPAIGGDPEASASSHPEVARIYDAVKEQAPTLRASTFRELVKDVDSRRADGGSVLDDLAQGRVTQDAVHLMKRARIIPPDEWRVLTSKAENWAKQFGISDDLPAPSRRDGAIATAYNLWKSGDLKLPPGLRRIMRGISDVAERAAA